MFENNLPANTVESPPKKVLLAEDDSSVRRFIEIILKRANYQVLLAEDGLSALQIALENQVHAIVSDAIMPNLSGYDLCRILRQNPNYQNIPFILLSGFENHTEEHQADAYLSKGNDLKNKLLESLSNLLVSKQLVTN